LADCTAAAARPRIDDEGDVGVLDDGNDDEPFDEVDDDADEEVEEAEVEDDANEEDVDMTADGGRRDWIYRSRIEAERG
jgi:hypothetical protein